MRLAGTALETRLAADGRTAVARVPAGFVLDGAAVAVRVLDASSPANAERARDQPARAPAAARSRGLSVVRGRVSGRVVAESAARVAGLGVPEGPRAAPRRNVRRRVPDGTFAVRVSPRRTTRYAVAVPESQQLRGLCRARRRHAARDGAHHGAARSASAATGWSCARASAGRGEATRLHLLVHDVRGGRWVEGCLEHGRPGVRLERTGSVWGTCRIPPSARGRAWTYRLVLAAPSSTWPWRTPSSASRSVLLPL